MKKLGSGLALVLLAAALPLVFSSAATAAPSYTCSFVQADGDAVFTFEGDDVGTAANLRDQDGWVATVTDQRTFTSADGAAGTYYVRLNTLGETVDCSDVTVVSPLDFTCFKLAQVDDAVLYFWGRDIGTDAQIVVDGARRGDVTGKHRKTVRDGADAEISVRLDAGRASAACDDEPPVGYSCSSLAQGEDAQLYFWGREVSSTPANLFDTSGRVATVTGTSGYVDVGGATDGHVVKLRKLRSVVACSTDITTDFACTATRTGDAMTLRFSGPAIGTNANVLRNGRWIATVTGETAYEIADGGGDTYVVKLHKLRTAVACEQGEPGEPMPFGRPGNWVLDFADEFDGTELNLDYWEPVWYDNGGFQRSVNDREEACYHRDQVAVRGGNLRMTLSEEDDPACQTKNGSKADYAGVQITTRNSRDQERYEITEGYIEARMWLPSTDGDLHNWPAFWVNGRNWPTQGELDIMEGLRERQPCASFHWEGPGGHEHKKWCPTPAWDEPGGWHVFAVDWSIGGLTYYYDGEPIGTAPPGTVTNEPHFMSLQYTVNTEWGPAVTDTALVDYVRVWQRAG